MKSIGDGVLLYMCVFFALLYNGQHREHRGELATKVGYFGVKSTNVPPGGQMGT